MLHVLMFIKFTSITTLTNCPLCFLYNVRLQQLFFGNCSTKAHTHAEMGLKWTICRERLQ